MLISSFTIARNADKLYFPIGEVLQSALPISDEVIVALGENDADDKTEEIIKQLGDSRIKIVHRTWDKDKYKDGQIFAFETTYALNLCRGIWCLYLQADEVLHEDDLAVIKEACKKYKDDLEVDGFLFDYVHFWGDYNHVLKSHGLISKEIRIVRNHIGCYSYKDAVSFRKGGNEKLKVVKINARIFHYGYIRPPSIMGVKKKVQDDIHSGETEITGNLNSGDYDWGPIGGMQRFKGTHPAAMKPRIAKFNWGDKLNYSKPAIFEKSPHKHLRPKYRLLTWLEGHFNGGKEIFGFKNYKLLHR